MMVSYATDPQMSAGMKVRLLLSWADGIIAMQQKALFDHKRGTLGWRNQPVVIRRQ
jgi:hypothetical protein